MESQFRLKLHMNMFQIIGVQVVLALGHTKEMVTTRAQRPKEQRDVLNRA